MRGVETFIEASCLNRSDRAGKSCLYFPKSHPQASSIGLIPQTLKLLHCRFVALPLAIAGQCPTASNEEIAPRQRLRPREVLKCVRVPVDFLPFAAIKTCVNGASIEVEMVVTHCACC